MRPSGRTPQYQHQLAGITISQNVNAACIGCKISSDLTTTLGSKTQRKQTTGILGRFLDIGEHAARFNGHGVVESIHSNNFIEPFEAKNDPTAGNATANKSCVSAERDNAYPVQVAYSNGFWPNLLRRPAAEPPRSHFSSTHALL